MESFQVILLALIAVPMVLATTVIGIPLAMQFAHGVSSRMSINSANAIEETAKASDQVEHAD